jgi:hypothetical protein
VLSTFHRRVSLIIAFFRTAVTGPKIVMLRLRIYNVAKSGPIYSQLLVPSEAEIMPSLHWNEPTVFPRAYFKHHRLPQCNAAVFAFHLLTGFTHTWKRQYEGEEGRQYGDGN